MIAIVLGWYLSGVLSYLAHCWAKGELLLGDVLVAAFLGLFGVLVPTAICAYSAIDVCGDLLTVPLWRRPPNQE